MIIINCFNKKYGRLCSIVSKILIYFNFINKKIKIFLLNYKIINLTKKKNYVHSKYIGSLKLENKNLKNKIKKSIYNMLPKNISRKNLINRIVFE